MEARGEDDGVVPQGVEGKGLGRQRLAGKPGDLPK